jgi:hypothetical protein
MKEMIKKIVTRLFPELNSGTHLPQLAVVVSVPDPPIGGEQHSHVRPYYAVDVRLLKPVGDAGLNLAPLLLNNLPGEVPGAEYTEELTALVDLSTLPIDKDMPLMRDIPVAMTGAAPQRGFAALPQPGTIVEVAFAFGMQSKPFIRSVLPWGMKLPLIDDKAQRWQQSAGSYQEVDRDGSWRRISSADIADRSSHRDVEAGKSVHHAGTTVMEQGDLIIRGNQIWIGGPAAKATGMVTFVNIPAIAPLIIPTGTIVSDASRTLRLKTMADVIIPPGTEKIQIPVQAEHAGEEYNQDKGFYNYLISPLQSIVSVVNEDPVAGGTDGINKFTMDGEFMKAVIDAFIALVVHTHSSSEPVPTIPGLDLTNVPEDWRMNLYTQAEKIKELREILISITKT